jgi:hypothetical protein
MSTAKKPNEMNMDMQGCAHAGWLRQALIGTARHSRKKKNNFFFF